MQIVKNITGHSIVLYVRNLGEGPDRVLHMTADQYIEVPDYEEFLFKPFLDSYTLSTWIKRETIQIPTPNIPDEDTLEPYTVQFTSPVLGDTSFVGDNITYTITTNIGTPSQYNFRWEFDDTDIREGIGLYSLQKTWSSEGTHNAFVTITRLEDSLIVTQSISITIEAAPDLSGYNIYKMYYKNGVIEPYWEHISLLGDNQFEEVSDPTTSVLYNDKIYSFNASGESGPYKYSTIDLLGDNTISYYVQPNTLQHGEGGANVPDNHKACVIGNTFMLPEDGCLYNSSTNSYYAVSNMINPILGTFERKSFATINDNYATSILTINNGTQWLAFGVNFTEAICVAELYDEVSGTWSEVWRTPTSWSNMFNSDRLNSVEIPSIHSVFIIGATECYLYNYDTHTMTHTLPVSTELLGGWSLAYNSKIAYDGNDTVYIITNQYTYNMFKYTISTNTLTNLQPLSKDGSNNIVAFNYKNNLLYAYVETKVGIYNPVTNTWSSIDGPININDYYINTEAHCEVSDGVIIVALLTSKNTGGGGVVYF